MVACLRRTLRWVRCVGCCRQAGGGGRAAGLTRGDKRQPQAGSGLLDLPFSRTWDSLFRLSLSNKLDSPFTAFALLLSFSPPWTGSPHPATRGFALPTPPVAVRHGLCRSAPSRRRRRQDSERRGESSLRLPSAPQAAGRRDIRPRCAAGSSHGTALQPPRCAKAEPPRTVPHVPRQPRRQYADAPSGPRAGVGAPAQARAGPGHAD